MFLSHKQETEKADTQRPEDYDEQAESDDSDSVNSFIVDDDGRPLTDRKKKRKHIFNDAYVFLQNFKMLKRLRGRT